MKPLFSPGFSPHEIKIIKKVTICSVCICIAVVAVSWIYNSNQRKAGSRAIPLIEQSTLIPLDITAHQLTAERYLQGGNPQKAIPHLQRILAFNNKDLSNHIALAHAFMEAGEYVKAFDIYNRLQSANLPDTTMSTICTRKGVALYYLGNKEESRQELNGCLDKYPPSAEKYCFLGQIEAASEGDSLKAKDYFEKAVKLDSSHVETWYQMARYWMFRENNLKARDCLLKAIDIDPLHSKSHARLGMIYYYLGNSELSRTSYLTAIAINPADFNTHYNLGELYYTRLNDTVNALKEFKKAIEEKPDHIEANFKIGLVCMKNNMVKEAIHYFERSLVLEPFNTRILLQLAVAFEKIQQRERAMTTYKRILSIDEVNGIARQKLRLLNQRQ